LTVDAGLRVDARSGSAEGAVQGIAWRTASPRLSFRWNPGPVVLFGGYGRYGSGTVLSLLSLGDPGTPWSEVRRWTDPNGNGLFDPGEDGVLVARSGYGAPVASIDAALASPRTTEWTIGAEYRRGTRMTLRGAIVVRRSTDLVGSINTGVPPSAYRVLVVPDANADELGPADDRLLEIYERRPASFGADAFLLTNPEAARSAYDGIEIGWELRSSRWSSIFGATAYRANGLGGHFGVGPFENDALVIGEQYERPSDPAVAGGRLFFDRAYVGKWTGIYRGPRDIGVAFVARYQDGQPFTRLVIAPNLPDGPGMVHAYPMGRTRFTYTATLDVRVEKGFAIGGRRAAIRLDVFNLTNHRNEVEEDIVTGPTFRQSTAVQPPLTMRLGLALDF
jgi:hypothetical protein